MAQASDFLPPEQHFSPYAEATPLPSLGCHQIVIAPETLRAVTDGRYAMAFVRKRGKSWYAYYDVYVDGKRTSKAMSFGRDKRGAEDFVLLKNADRIRGVQEPAQESFRSWWQRYEREYLPGLTEKTQFTYRKVAERLEPQVVREL